MWVEGAVSLAVIVGSERIRDFFFVVVVERILDSAFIMLSHGCSPAPCGDNRGH